MNERIAELKSQCIVREQRGTSAFDSYMVNRFDTEKFAELIVKECTDVLNKRFVGDLNREDMEVRRCIADVNRHFGIHKSN